MSNTQLSQIKGLLEKVSVISKKYHDIAQIRGENFNIFSIMSMETNERYTHSAMIGELLNPRGSHGQGSVFLKLFFKEIECLKPIHQFNFENAKVTVEKYLGSIDLERKTGGYIDIIIEDGNNTIIIENKIYAVDQVSQLERYKNHYKQAVLLYLNLYGNEPSGKSKGQLEVNKDFYLITYKSHIKNWLEECHQQVVNQPVLRETIKQYLHLVKKLTNQTINNDMSDEIKSLLLSDLKSAKEISDNFHSAKAIILNKIRDGLKKELEKIYEDRYYFFENHNRAEEKNSHIWFSLKDYKEDDKQIICFGLESFSGYSNNQNDLFIGILDFYNSYQILFKEYFPDMKINGWWRGIESIGNFESYNIDFSDIDFLQFLYDNPFKLPELIRVITDKTMEYINRHEKTLITILSSSRKIKETQF
ncbi:PDDEXK-like family protein [Chryseobacterium gallinarum]|uniref:PD-(D/E)XK nuclease family protein n=1 Tax=Chryseobacterium gallinarum TaxID=1324352 RepID=A0ABX6KNB5_CHRGL|nr:PD-(D/E)XK nuclease family protein [Chryseobacterium gallinarum]QIY89673.1 PD-(D/E)XK nuclease family protein [Chryseobacterium gallinarum]